MGDELAEQTGRGASRRDLLYPRAFVAAHLGDVDTARTLALEGLDAAEMGDNRRTLLRHLSVLGFLELSLSRPTSPAAAAYLERAAEVATAAGYLEPNWLRFHDDLGETLVETARLEEATTLLARLDSYGEVTRYPWTLATAARLRGQLSAARGDREDAVAAFAKHSTSAADSATRSTSGARTSTSDDPPPGCVNASRHERCFTEALSRFEGTGASLWVEIARTELGRISGRRQGEPNALTSAEQLIAEQVALGRSNKEVAATLHLSVKTVEVTLTRVYRKLGVRSRAELAAPVRRSQRPRRSTRNPTIRVAPPTRSARSLSGDTFCFGHDVRLVPSKPCRALSSRHTSPAFPRVT